MTFAPDGRLFVCEQDGTLRVVKNGVLLSAPFMTLGVHSEGERGLISVAFDPDFATNQYLYVFYTHSASPVRNRVSRFTASGDFVVPGSEVKLLELDGSRAFYHNGGALHFGPDGKLYLAVGDNTRLAYSQSREQLLGKVLRMNKDGSVPNDNPFSSDSSVTGLNKLIWALGLRNPYTFAFDRQTGKMFIADVGFDSWEEINIGVAGANYGWSTVEGPVPAGGTPIAGFTYPAYAYSHHEGRCAIIGGDVYRPTIASLPSKYIGKFFFGDVCAQWIKVFDPETNTVEEFATETSDPSDMDIGPDGALYYVVRREGGGPGAGTIFRIAAAGDSPAITSDPLDQTVTIGGSATFAATASGSEPLSYQWQRNGVPIAGATSTSYVLPSVTSDDNGVTFRVVVTNSHGSATSRSAVLSVTANRAPVARITAPAAGFLYTAGTNLTFTGTATDAEDGTLPASAFSWMVLFHHDTHTHPFVPATPGVRSKTVFIPNDDHPEHSVWYRIYLTVRDSEGATNTVFRDVFPRKNAITLVTNPPGLQLNLDGPPVTAPYTTPSVVGVIRTLGAPLTQTKNGLTYTFLNWSQGGPALQTVTTTAANQTFTANYQVSGGATTLEPTFVYRDSANNVRLQRHGTATPTIAFGNLAGNPAAAQDLAGDTWVAARSFNSLYINRYRASTNLFTGWTFLGGILVGDPAIIVSNSGKVWMALRDPFNAYYITSYDPVNGAGPYIYLGGIFGSDPSLTLSSNGNLYIVGRDQFGAVWTSLYNTTTNAFGGWVNLGGITKGKPVGRFGPDSALYIATRDIYDGIWMVRYAGGSPIWYKGGGVSATDPVLVSDGTGVLYATILDLGGALYYRGFTAGVGNAWQNWTTPGGILTQLSAAGGGNDVWVAGSAPNGIFWWRKSLNQWSYIGVSSEVNSQLFAALE